MKTTLMSLLFALMAVTTFAQTSDAEADAIINLLHVQKREAVAKLVPVTGKDSIAFWKIYGEYEAENKLTAKVRLQLYEKTALSYTRMTAAVADSLAMKYFANRDGQEKTLELYYKKVRAATNAIVAFEFYQAEIYILTQVRASIMQQIPAYGLLQGAKKNQ